MATLQLLARASDDASGGLSWFEPSPDLPVREYDFAFNHAPGHALRLGTQALLQLSIALRDLGYRTVRVTLESTTQRGPSARQEDETVLLSEEIVDRLYEDPAEDVLSYCRDHMVGYYIFSIEARGRGGVRFTLRRDGWLTVHDVSATADIKRTMDSSSRLVGIA